MLVLSRKLGERILIPLELTFSMVAIDGNTAKLGITAPSHVGVYR
jgi:carbon storage regulator